MNDLTEFIQKTTDVRELKRALAVKMTLSGVAWADVMDALHVSHAFISKWRSQYKRQGSACLRMGYQGTAGRLTPVQKSQLIVWLRQQTTWSVTALHEEILRGYGIEYASKQSYYALMADARLSWKKTQAANPNGNPDLIAAKREEIQKKSRRRSRRSSRASDWSSLWMNVMSDGAMPLVTPGDRSDSGEPFPSRTSRSVKPTMGRSIS